MEHAEQPDDGAEQLLVGLDREQRLAVVATEHPLAIIAPAGSGKTTVLTRRIAYRVATNSADADHVVALTFTRQAAGELRQRLWRLGVRGPGLRVGTFHAVAHALLRQRWMEQSRRAPTLLSSNRRLLAEVIGARHDPGELAAVATELEWSRARLVASDRYIEAARRAGRRPPVDLQRVAGYLSDYATLKKRRGVVDFDDLLADCATEIRSDTNYAQIVRWRFRHLFVDEFQDLNPLQHHLLEAWRGSRPDICVVGDPRQAIYGWNGADPQLLERIDETLPGVTVIRLVRNYRCTPQIVAAAAGVFPAGMVDDTSSMRPDGPVVETTAAADEAAEAELVARRVRTMRPPGGRWSAIGVLARTNAQLPVLARALDRVGVPHVVLGSGGRTAPDDVTSGLMEEARRIKRAGELASWSADLADSELVATHLTAPGTVNARPIDGDTIDGDTIDGGRAQLAARLSVSVAARRFLTEVPSGDGAAFADWFLLGAGETVLHDAVELATFHAAKGREWRGVVVAGFETDLVPHSSARTAEARAEEARLAHVAFTRAAEHLVITWAMNRHDRTTGPSTLVPRAAVDQSGDVLTLPRRETLQRADSSESTAGTGTVLASLVEWRRRAARAARLPPASIIGDDTLRILAAEQPLTLDEVVRLAELGPSTSRHLGPRLLDAIVAALSVES